MTPHGPHYTPEQALKAVSMHVECLARHALDGVRRCDTPTQGQNMAVQAGLLAALLMSIEGIRKMTRADP